MGIFKENKLIIKKDQNGYAILFAIVIVSVIALISMGLANTSYKQILLSSVASDSQAAYFQSDTATECVIYADVVVGVNPSGAYSPWWGCGVDWTGANATFNIQPYDPSNPDPLSFKATSTLTPSNAPCFEFDSDKRVPNKTTLYARGYNTCDKTSPRTVEREIKITY